LAAAIFVELAAPADYVIDLHSGGVEYVFLPVAGFYGESASGNPSFQAARTFGLPALWQLPETDGVLSCEAWRRGRIAIGTEYLGAGLIAMFAIIATELRHARRMGNAHFRSPAAKDTGRFHRRLATGPPAASSGVLPNRRSGHQNNFGRNRRYEGQPAVRDERRWCDPRPSRSHIPANWACWLESASHDRVAAMYRLR
jgi:hypothetical protein